MKTKKQKKTMKQRKTRKQRKTKKQRKIRGGDLDASVKDIVRRFIQDRENNQAKMLNVVCKNSDNCLALGVYGQIIKQYFDNFRNLSLVNRSGMKRIGNNSNNGFIIELPFTKNGFTAYTALKCSTFNYSDNLFYEYYVGKFFINNYLNVFPCFVETYDSYTFKNETSWSKVQDFTNPNNIDLTQLITLKKVSENRNPENNYDTEDTNMFGLSCRENKHICVLIQHFDNFRSVKYEYTRNYNNIQYEILNILYQVYFPLTILKDVYTHYDLNSNNVFLYKPYEGTKYIQMRYHLLSGSIIEFPSEYIVKIIDYGRNYFDNGMTNTQKILNNAVRNDRRCDPDCGARAGYRVIQGNECDPNKDIHWIFPNKKNMSHDLRFAVFFYDYLKQLNIFNTFVYNNVEVTHKKMPLHGTPEKLGGDIENIYNIVNFKDFLEVNIDKYNQPMNQKYNSTWKKVAVMDIYEDKRPYTFVVLPDTA